MDPREPAVAVFTDHGDPSKFVPFRRVVPSAGIGGPYLRALRQAWRLWRSAQRFPGVAALVTYGSTTGFALAALQCLARPWREPRTHYMFDLLLDKRRAGLPGWYDRLKAAAFRGGGTCAVLWGAGDPDTFAAGHGLPRERLQFHPYHMTLEGFTWEERDGGYIFAGGDSGRDYATVIAALGGLGYPVFIATTNPAIPPLAAAHPQITVRGVTPAEFRQKLAGCTFLVEAHPADFPRTAGHQTLLNAMAMGKAVVLADRGSSWGYLDDGVEGLVVPAGDVAGLRQAAARLLADPQVRAGMGAAGRRRLQNPIYTTAVHMQSIYNLALRREQARIAPGRPPVLIELYAPATDARAYEARSAHGNPPGAARER